MFFSRLFLLFFLFISMVVYGQDPTNLEHLMKENQLISESSAKLTTFYELAPDEQIREITSEVLASPNTTESQKINLLEQERRIFVFNYPSDGLKVKGLISFTPHAEHHPLLIFLRGGNREFGLIHPAMDLVSYKDYTVISTLYRGGVSEGQDEFGGADVEDVNHLVEFIPHLLNLLDLPLHPSHTYMLGASRGGLEMFLALARHPELQNKVDKIVSLSGLLDLRQQIQDRPDMRQMFEEDFGLIPGVNEEEWMNRRDPILTVSSIKPDLPILIIQGSEDKRVNPAEGHKMVQQLEADGHHVTYWEITGGQHALCGMHDRMDLIASWLEIP